MTMPTIATTTGLALSAGWGYGLINRVSVRYGSSAQYFWSGQQMLLQNLMDAENSSKVDAIVSLGGNAVSGASCSGATANLYLKLPHNSVRASGKPLPFPSDLLVQPIVITIELLAASSVFILNNGGGSISTAPAALANAQLQVKQEMLTDTSDLLARRVDMNSSAYCFPLMYFCQQETQVPIANVSGVLNSVNLTGFRAGEVRSILLWANLNSDQVPGAGSFNPLVWQPITQVTLTYNGEVFSRFDGNSAQLWNISADEKSNTANFSYWANGAASAAAVQTTWVECPFSQVNVPYDKEMKLAHGKPILNAVVNLTFLLPANTAAYTLHAMYIYNASLLCSRGSAEYIF